jgi:hypothetical protein
MHFDGSPPDIPYPRQAMSAAALPSPTVPPLPQPDRIDHRKKAQSRSSSTPLSLLKPPVPPALLSDVDDSAPEADPALYLPEAILERQTEVIFRRISGKHGSRKKVVGWADSVLVKWNGYHVSESAWEDIAFYEQYYLLLLTDYLQSRVPRRVIGRYLHPQTRIAHYKIVWRGSQTTTMETAALVEAAPEFATSLTQYREASDAANAEGGRGRGRI